MWRQSVVRDHEMSSGEIFWGQDRLELLDRALKQLA
jgi:2-hydroxychromene-2-carboxylate isomerase